MVDAEEGEGQVEAQAGFETLDEMDGVEAEPESALPREKAAPKSSIGAAAFEAVQGEARKTLLGVRRWAEAGRWAYLGEVMALIASAILVLILLMGDNAPRILNTVGVYLGVAAFALWLFAGLFFLFGILATIRGRNELGVLQSREVNVLRNAMVRAMVVLLGGAVVALAIGVNASTGVRPGRMENATLYSVIAGLISCSIAFAIMSQGIQAVLRNLTPRGGKRMRRRFHVLFMGFAVLAMVGYLAGAPFAYLDWAQGCVDLGGCSDTATASMFSPPFGAPAHMFGNPPMVGLQQYSLIAAGVLLLARLLGIMAIGTFRRQLAEADNFLVGKVAAARRAQERAAAGAL